MKPRYDGYIEADSSLTTVRDIRERIAIVLALFSALLALGIAAVLQEASRQSQLQLKQQRSTVLLPENSGVSDYSQGLVFVTDGDFGSAIACFEAGLKKQNDPAMIARYLVARGVALAHLGNVDAALADFTSAHSKMPHSSSILMNLALAQEETHDVRTAIATYSRAISLWSGNAEAYGNRARCWFHLQQYENAVADLSDLVRISTNDPIVFVNRAIVLGKMGRYAMAVSDLEQPCVKLAATAEVNKLLATLQAKGGSALQSLATIRSSLEIDPADHDLQLLAAATMSQLARSKTPVASIARASLDTTLTDVDPSLQDIASTQAHLLEIEDAFQAYGPCTNSYQLLDEPLETEEQTAPTGSSLEMRFEAIAFLERGDLFTAAAFLNESLRLDPTDIASRRLRALVCLDLEQFPQVHQDLERLITQAPQDPEIRTLAGMAFSVTGDFESALAALDNAVRLQPENPVVYANRAFARFEEGSQPLEVVRDCERAQQRGQVSAPLQDLKARAYRQLEDFENAFIAHSSACELAPNDAQIRLSFVRSLQDENLHLDALIEVEKVLQVAPTHQAALFSKAESLAQLKDFDSALAILRQLVAAGNTSASVRMLEAESLFQLGYFQEAAEAYLPLSEQSSEPHVIRRLAECYSATGNAQLAWNTFETLRSHGEYETPTDLETALRYATGAEAYESVYELLAKLTPKAQDPASNSLALARAAQRIKKWQQSLEHLADFLKSNQDDREAWYLSGIGFRHTRQSVKAVKCLSQSLALSPGWKPALIERAQVFVELGDFTNAMADVDQLMRIDSADLIVQQLRVACSEGLKN